MTVTEQHSRKRSEPPEPPALNDWPLYGGERPRAKSRASGVTVLEALPLSQIVELHDDVERVLERRFQNTVALVLAEPTGPAEDSNRGLCRSDLLKGVAASLSGRIVRAKSGADVMSFRSVQDGLQAAVELQKRCDSPVRCSVHWCKVLTDGAVVVGEPVDACARLVGLAQAGEILLTRDALKELGSSWGTCLKALPAARWRGVTDARDAMQFDWQSGARVPAYVRIGETVDLVPLPQKEVISFGRYHDRAELAVGNDVTLKHPDSEHNARISRWQFELRRLAGVVVLRSLSVAPTVVNGELVSAGEQVKLEADSVVDVAGVLRLEFLCEDRGRESGG